MIQSVQESFLLSSWILSFTLNSLFYSMSAKKVWDEQSGRCVSSFEYKLLFEYFCCIYLSSRTFYFVARWTGKLPRQVALILVWDILNQSAELSSLYPNFHLYWLYLMDSAILQRRLPCFSVPRSFQVYPLIADTLILCAFIFIVLSLSSSSMPI